MPFACISHHAYSISAPLSKTDKKKKGQKVNKSALLKGKYSKHNYKHIEINTTKTCLSYYVFYNVIHSILLLTSLFVCLYLNKTQLKNKI